MTTPLPRSWYLDRELFDAEMAAVFGHAWLPVVHGSQLDLAGSYVAATVGGRDILLVKDRDDTIRAFHNACRHRAHRLLDGAGQLGDTITCPHHGWSCRLDGTLCNAPQCDDAGLDSSCLGLEPVRTAMLAGFVVVCFDTSADELPNNLRHIETLLLHDHPQLPAMKEVRRREAVIQANWKTIIENYLECYHCDVAHPSFGNFDVTTWKHFVGEGWTRQSRVEPDLNDDAIDDSNVVGLSAWWQWPNIFWARALGADTFVAAFHEPLAPDLTRQTRVIYAASHREDDELRKFNDLFDDVFQEDVSVVESVQRGLGSRGYRGGVLVEQRAARAGWSEHAVHYFQDLVRGAISV
jgi:choline monooxygenase